VAIAHWFTFELACELMLGPTGLGARAGTAEIVVTTDGIFIARLVTVPALGVLDKLRSAVAGEQRIDDAFTVLFSGKRVDARAGDMLRASRDSMGRRHASLARAGADGVMAPFWTFDDPPSGFG
jgi:antitoxin (DNA-binding transcriptional repressor) of toxin-antitoxin stability system